MSRAQKLKSGDVSLGLAHEWVCAFGRQGGTAAMLQQTIEDSAAMQLIIDTIPRAPVVMPKASHGTGITYDATATRILGLPAECSDPAPETADGEIVIYYGGWDLPALRTCTAGKKWMRQDQDWYDNKGWKAEPGYYRLLLPVPNSNRQRWGEQLQHLAGIDAAWQPAPICIAATALLAHLMETGQDLLRNDWCRCAEPLPGGFRAALTVLDGRVLVDYYWDDDPHVVLWLAASRKS